MGSLHKWRGSRTAVVMMLVAGGCWQADSGSQQIDAPVPASAATESTGPQLALSYVPGDSPADAQIAGAQAALRSNPQSVDAHVALATSLLRKTRESSRSVFRVYADDVIRSARSLGNDRRIRSLTTMLMLDAHRFGPAADAASELIAEDPADPTGHLLLGDALLELGDYDDATDAYQAALDVRPDLRSYNRAAYMRWLYGDLEGAVKIMDLALGAGNAREPESMAWCFTDLGAMYLDRGDVRRAIAASDRALAFVEGYVPARTLRAQAQARNGELAPAIDLLQSVLEVRPTAEDALRLSELLEQTDRAAEAREARATAEQLALHDPRPLAHFLARHAETPTRALALARAELDARHGIWAHDTLALALLRNGEIAEARAAIDKALALGTRKADFHLHAAMIEAAAGRTTKAKRGLALALELDPGVDPLLVDELRRQLGDA